MSHTDNSPVLPVFQQMLKIRRPLPRQSQIVQVLIIGILLAPPLYRVDQPMTLRIEKTVSEHKTIIRLSGRVRSEHLDELKMQIDGGQSPIALDLEGVTLLSIDVVRFLNACEKRGVELLHCSPYIREWMIRENARE
jgi:hypothetical protein